MRDIAGDIRRDMRGTLQAGCLPNRAAAGHHKRQKWPGKAVAKAAFGAVNDCVTRRGCGWHEAALLWRRRFGGIVRISLSAFSWGFHALARRTLHPGVDFLQPLAAG